MAVRKILGVALGKMGLGSNHYKFYKPYTCIVFNQLTNNPSLSGCDTALSLPLPSCALSSAILFFITLSSMSLVTGTGR